MSKKKSEKLKKAEFEVNEANLLPVNPLMQSVIITPEEETEQKVELMEEVQSLAVLNKQVLEAKRRTVELEVDNKKLDAARKVADNLESILDVLSDPEVLKNVKQNTKTSLDYKLMSEAGLKQAEILKNLMNPTVADEFGGRKKTKIMAAFQTPTGEKMMLSAELPDNG